MNKGDRVWSTLSLSEGVVLDPNWNGTELVSVSLLPYGYHSFHYASDLRILQLNYVDEPEPITDPEKEFFGD